MGSIFSCISDNKEEIKKDLGIIVEDIEVVLDMIAPKSKDTDEKKQSKRRHSKTAIVGY